MSSITKVPGRSTRKGSAKLSKKPKKPRPLPVLIAVKPLNIDSEKEKFFSLGGRYNPQFTYCEEIDSKTMSQYSEPSNHFLSQALKIIHSSLSIFGSYSNWEKYSGGEIMTKEEVHEYVTRYLKAEGIEDEIRINITHGILSHASMTKIKGKPTINIKEGTTHTNWINGMLHHEIGTHYIRSFNNGKQLWKTKKRRKKYGLQPANPTEEGLASLHTNIQREQPVMLRSALMYLTIYIASKMSFMQVFEYLKKFVDCPEARWKYVIRAKRGQTDTSKPGCFPKDQVYLTGSLQILSRRHDINFENLYRFGKISYLDLDKLEEKATVEGTRIPKFVRNRTYYLGRLQHIVEYNGLTDADLTTLAGKVQTLTLTDPRHPASSTR